MSGDDAPAPPRLPVLQIGGELSSAAEIKDDWYLACTSDELGQGPISRELFGLKIVLFRDSEGRASALLDRCPHRNIPLSEGKIIDGEIQCRYHGWRFDGAGRCRAVPGLCGDSDVEARRAGPLALEEQQGLVWVWATPGESPLRAPHELPCLGAPGYTSVAQSFEVDGTMHALAENTLDVPHTAFLHGGLFRKPGRDLKIEVVVRRWHDRVEAEYIGEPRPSGLVGRLLAPGGGTVQHIDRFWLPSICEVDYRLGERSHINVQSLLTPIRKDRTRLTALTSVRLPMPGWLVKPFLVPLARRIFAQDADVLASQKDTIARFEGERFVSTELDALGPEILRMLRAAQRGDRRPFAKAKEQRFWMRI